MFSNTVIKLKRVIRFWLKIDLTPKLRALQKAELVAQADHVENEMEFLGEVFAKILTLLAFRKR